MAKTPFFIQETRVFWSLKTKNLINLKSDVRILNISKIYDLALSKGFF